MHEFLRSLAMLGVLLLGSQAWADDWPQWLGPKRDGVWRESGILEKFPTQGPSLRWRTAIGPGYSGPAVANGKVYITDRQIAPGARNPSNPFEQTTIPGTERVLCLNEADGKILWQHDYDCPYTVSYPAGPRASPLVDEGRVYTLGTEGHLLCLDATTGKVLWSKVFTKQYGIKTPLWGFSAHPLVDGNKLICLAGGDGSVAVAFDKKSGREIWRSLTAKEPGYCPPMIYDMAGKRQLVIWHPESINSLDPNTGQLHWSEPFPVQSALSIPTPRVQGDLLFVTAFYDGSRMWRITAGNTSLVWKSAKVSEKDTDGLHSIMSTPFLDGDYIYGVCSYGQLRCLKADTGERLWETLRATTPDEKPARWANAFLIKHRDRFFLSNEKGDLIIAELSPAGYR
jgi:outer membrane protein assembly factor BamB